MPRWWRGGTEWLDGLPGLVDAQCEVWGLQVDGIPLHGSNAIVVPVRGGPRGDDALALRMTPPGDDLSALVEALRFWDGRGTVTLVDVDVPAGALLLERLDARRSLSSLPLDDAIPVLARTMLRLARPAPAHVPSTTQRPFEERATLVAAWHSAGAGRHATLAQFHAAEEAADLLSATSLTSRPMRTCMRARFWQVRGKHGWWSIQSSCAVTWSATSRVCCGAESTRWPIPMRF